jgi:hypothetical protein
MTQVCENIIADVQMIMERVAGDANVDDEAHEPRRRYVLNGTSQAKESSESRNSTKKDSWNYKVIQGRWGIPEKEKKTRRAIAIGRCNERTLRNVASGKIGRKHKKNEPKVEEAIKELKQLR